MTVEVRLLSKTGDELREMARECMRRREESWERSDSDGFLSQWASQQMASHYERFAEYADNGWMREDQALFDATTGELLDARTIEAEFNGHKSLRWMVTNPDGSRRYFAWSHARKAERRRTHYAKNGVTLGRVARRVVPLSDGHTMPDRDYPEVTVLSKDDVGEDWN